MPLTRLIPAAVVLVLIAGCAERDANEDHFLEAQQEALERARAVEAEVLEAAERRRRQMEEYE